MTTALTIVTLVVSGFVACAEFGSWAFVHPVIRRLPAREHIQVEQGLLRTFGRVMPVGMPLTLVLAITLASANTGSADAATVWSWLAVASLAAAVSTTLIVNVPINLATGRWDADNPPADWKETRNRWERFQGVRSCLLVAGFILVTIAAVLD